MLPELNEIKALINQGETEKAQSALLEVIRVEPQNKTAWLWLAQTMPTDVERLEVLEEYMKTNPAASTQTIPRLIEMLKFRAKATPTKPGPDRLEVMEEQIKADRTYQRLVVILLVLLLAVVAAAAFLLLKAAGVI
jgi:thioredoxin-like negative regulator of GroEL